MADAYPAIPALHRDDPGLALVLYVEGNIVRADGVIQFSEMLRWLRFHGVRDRAEVLEWEWFFREIAAIRGRIMEELREVPAAKDAKSPADGYGDREG